MSQAGNLDGEIVSKEKVANDLRFSSVHEMRRWESEIGQKVWKLEEKLRAAKSDKNQFLWSGRRMEKVLEKVYEYMKKREDIVFIKDEIKLRLATAVVLGKEVDWSNKLKEFFDEPQDKKDSI